MFTTNKIVGAKRESILSDLFLIGEQKPLGCLPVSTIKKYGYSVDQLKHELESRGLVVILFEMATPNESGFFNRASLYAYNHAALANFLNQNQSLLINSGWPTEPREFALRVHQETVYEEANPELYACIGRAFNDPRFRAERPKNSCPYCGGERGDFELDDDDHTIVIDACPKCDKESLTAMVQEAPIVKPELN